MVIIPFKKRGQSLLFILLFLLIIGNNSMAQVVINEGSNRNYSTIADEDGEYPDWIELYNAGHDTVNLFNYALTDDILAPGKWTFPNIKLMPKQYKTIFCSGKDRKPISAFIDVASTDTFTPIVGWNTHTLTTPFYWDGVSNILINTCSYNSSGYTTNSVFNQTTTSYFSTIFAFQDGNPDICKTTYGTKVSQRPNIQLNNHTIGNGVVQNSPYDYPAPYGNWYWAAKNQMLIPATELSASGLTAGNITSIAFDVASTDSNTVYDYIDISMKLVSINNVSSVFTPVDTSISLHTNFKISTSGETVYLFSPTQVQLSSLHVNCNGLDNSIGSLPDSSSNIVLFVTPTPAASNNQSSPYHNYLLPPVFSVSSGMYGASVSVSITNPNPSYASIRYTIDGSDPSHTSPLYSGTPVNILYSAALKARAFADTVLPSPITVSSYLIGVDHATPILSVVTDKKNLYGASGMFDNWSLDWQKAAYVEYFDTTHQLIFSQNAGIQIDGGWGGSRQNPQHSFRVELAHAVLGDGPVNYVMIPDKPYRTKYSRLYLRNGSNQYLSFPIKDACQVKAMANGTDNYYSAWRPVTVYINGTYFGLYELREKYDPEYFKVIDNANVDSVEILSQSAWGGSILQPVVGSVDSFYTSYAAFKSINTADTAFWNKADNYFDMTFFNDYIIAESWIANKDWPWNNIKIYRSDKTHHRWRFCLMDMELSLDPNGWTDYTFDHIQFMMSYDQGNPYINIWQRGIQNEKFKNYFINRFADVMNTSYEYNQLSVLVNNIYDQEIAEMPNEYMRWGDPNNIPQEMTDFNNNEQSFLLQLSKRTEQVRNHIQANFSLAGQVNVTLNTTPAGAGKIKISTIIPDSLPWTGVYFNGNPVKITAIPNPGYNFSFWMPNLVMPIPGTNPAITLNITSNATFNAVFTVNPNVGKLSISELNYNSDSTRNAGDWIEFHNYGNGPLDLSEWKFSDSTYNHNYIFPSGTIVQPGEWIVLAEDTMKFHVEHPGVAAFGPTGFGFSNSSESLTLYDFTDAPRLWMHYDDSLPWPMAADGYGRTLEIINDTLNPALPESWFAGCIGGSPGGPYVTCPEQIIFSEINYKSLPTIDAGDWIELHNKGTVDVDISGWQFRDAVNTHTYSFSQGTVLHPSGYLALFNDITKFNAQFPAITNSIGPFTFGLGNAGDAIRLFDSAGRLYQSVLYNNTAPWPVGANGYGFTLEILNPDGHFCDGTNWFDGCPKGSPGGPYVFPCNVSVEDLSRSDVKIDVFPNPSDGKFTINFDGDENSNACGFIEISNPLGSMVFSKPFTNRNRLLKVDISDVPGGIYLVKIYLKEKIYTTRIVVFSKE